MATLSLYSVFHLNLAYSSIPEKRFSDVVSHCYWPLLRTLEKTGARAGIEASGFTLREINKIDPSWIRTLKALIDRGQCEFIGSGHAQIIGPLVPHDVNRANLALGNEVYGQLLGRTPETAFVGEQAYAGSLIEHYRQAGYLAIITEWNNSAMLHPEWPDHFQYHSQTAEDQWGNSIPVVWNNSHAFQRFQRYAYGETPLENYTAYLRSHIGKERRFFPLYGSDAEIFDFRTNRYNNEASLIQATEWKRIRKLLAALRDDPQFEFVLPREVYVKNLRKKHGKNIRLESSEDPAPVKKRDVYNIVRWALSGRDNVGVNTTCFRIHAALRERSPWQRTISGTKRDAWRELCELWGSDFRTHTEKKKFIRFQERLTRMAARYGARNNHIAVPVPKSACAPSSAAIEKKVHTIIVNTNTITAELNTKKGLAFERVVFKRVSRTPLFGFLPNDFYRSILLGDGFFSGHANIGIPLRQKITDLSPATPHYTKRSSRTLAKGASFVPVSSKVKTEQGTIAKTVAVFRDESRIDLSYAFDLHGVNPSSFRGAIITFNPDAFDLRTLYYAFHNGGARKEVFPLGKSRTISPDLANHLVSAKMAYGATEGVFEIGDKNLSLSFKTSMAERAALPMLAFERTLDTRRFLLRLYYSLREYDETSLLGLGRKNKKDRYGFTVRIRATKKRS